MACQHISHVNYTMYEIICNEHVDIDIHTYLKHVIYRYTYNANAYRVFVNFASVTTSPGNPLDNRLSLASLLDFAKRDRPNPISSMKDSLEDKNPCQW